MNKNTIIAGILVAAAVGAGFYFYKKTKGGSSGTASAAKPASSNALTNAGIALGTSAANDFLSWLTGPASNTGSNNSTSGTSDDDSGYLDTGLNWL